MYNIVAVFLGSGLGAVLRYLAGIYSTKYLNLNLPVSTFAVNILGSFILGFLYCYFIDKPEIKPALKLALTVGFCGGLTTFSTFSLEMFEMLKTAQFINAIIYAVISVTVCVIAVMIGVYCAKFV